MKAWLDLARLMLALVVVFDHVVIINFLPTNHLNATTWFFILNILAASAVCGFFMISGYAIAHSVTSSARSSADAQAVDSAPPRFGLRNFVVNRIARIYPPLLLAIGAAWGFALVIVPIAPIDLPDEMSIDQNGLAYFWAMGTENPFWVQTLHTLFMLHGPFGAFENRWELIAPVWTLPYEILAYAVAGLSFRFFAIRHELAWAIGASLWCGLWIFCLYSDLHPIKVLLGLWSLGFAIGLLARWHMALCLMAVLVVGLPLLASLGIHAFGLFPTAIDPYGDAWSMTTLVAGAVFILVFTLGAISRGLAKLFRLRGSVPVPDFSYTLYLLHFPLLLTVAALANQSTLLQAMPIWFWSLLAVAVIIFVSWMLSIFVEQKRGFAAILRPLFLLPLRAPTERPTANS